MSWGVLPLNVSDVAEVQRDTEGEALRRLDDDAMGEGAFRFKIEGVGTAHALLGLKPKQEQIHAMENWLNTNEKAWNDVTYQIKRAAMKQYQPDMCTHELSMLDAMWGEDADAETVAKDWVNRYYNAGGGAIPPPIIPQSCKATPPPDDEEGPWKGVLREFITSMQEYYDGGWRTNDKFVVGYDKTLKDERVRTRPRARHAQEAAA